MSSFLTGNRVRRAYRKGEKLEDNDHFLTRDAKQVEPLLVSSADCVNRTHKKFPCYYCLCEGIWYTIQPCPMLVWDTEDLECVDLPHNDGDIVMFSVKYYLPVRWIAENGKVFKEGALPSAESLNRLNPTASLSLNDVFATIMGAYQHTSGMWERNSDNPPERARMIDIVYKVARQHQYLFENAYAPFQLQFNCKLFLKVAGSFRQPFTGGIRPKKRVTTEQQRAELLRTNVNRVNYEVYCHYKEWFDPMP